MVRAIAGMALLLACIDAGAAPLRHGLDVQVPHPPTPAWSEGRCTLRHELHLTNFDAAPRKLRALTVLDGDSVLLQLAGDALAAHVAAVGEDPGDARRVAPGMRRVVHLDADCGARVPAAIAHRVETDVDGEIHVAPSPVRAAARASLGSPLRGGPWVAIASPDWPRGHRRVFYAIDGRARLPGRHAIDFVRVDEAGGTTRGDAILVADTLGHGDDVLAVADAQVAATRDDVAEAVRIDANARHALEDAAGNFVSLRLADGRHVLYEHLKPGSVRVRAGDRVARGQVIAQLGFTGDSTGPHLHFHVADAPQPLRGEGLPFAFERFTLLGRYDDLGDLGQRRWREREATLAAVRRDESPGSNRVVRFDD